MNDDDKALSARIAALEAALTTERAAHEETRQSLHREISAFEQLSDDYIKLMAEALPRLSSDWARTRKADRQTALLRHAYAVLRFPPNGVHKHAALSRLEDDWTLYKAPNNPAIGPYRRAVIEKRTRDLEHRIKECLENLASDPTGPEQLIEKCRMAAVRFGPALDSDGNIHPDQPPPTKPGPPPPGPPTPPRGLRELVQLRFALMRLGEDMTFEEAAAAFPESAHKGVDRVTAEAWMDDAEKAAVLAIDAGPKRRDATLEWFRQAAFKESSND